jgi:hypothetical protein
VVSPSRGAPALAVNSRGDAIAMWQAFESTPDALQATRQPAAADSWGATTELVTGDRIGAVGIAIDGSGDAIAIWERNDGRWWVESSASDVSPPVVAKLVVPKSGLVRKPIRLSVTARDTWSGTLVPAWTFGDGSKTRGSTVTHRYRSPGRYRVTVTVADSVGHATTSARFVRIRR